MLWALPNMIIVLFSTLYEMSILHVLSTTSCVSACVFCLSCLLILDNIGFGESLDGTYLASGHMSCQRHSPKATCPKYPVNLEIIQRTGGQANLLVMASYLKSNKQQVLSQLMCRARPKEIGGWAQHPVLRYMQAGTEHLSPVLSCFSAWRCPWRAFAVCIGIGILHKERQGIRFSLWKVSSAVSKEANSYTRGSPHARCQHPCSRMVLCRPLQTEANIPTAKAPSKALVRSLFRHATHRLPHVA